MKTAEEKIEDILAWAKAYPVAVFPEPNWSRVAMVLSDHGMTIDAISASNMRHVLKGVIAIIENDNG